MAFHVVDFETEEIQPRPDYPPKPVGVSIIKSNRKARYYAWGHSVENNCTESEAIAALQDVWNSKTPIVFHNAKFDLDVSKHLGFNELPKGGIEDTMLMAFIFDPREPALHLKSLANKYCQMPPDEQEELRDWILKNCAESKGKPKTWRNWGSLISKAPGKLVGKYANGDTTRTLALAKFYLPKLKEFDMIKSYRDKLKALQALNKNEWEGIPVDLLKLRHDVRMWEQWLYSVDAWISKETGVKHLDVDKAEQLAAALDNAGLAANWVLTATGKRSMAKDNIVASVSDDGMLSVLQYRSKLVNSLRNFGRPWLEVAEKSKGLIYTNWNQVVSTDVNGKKATGARTGRLSSNPNFQNMPNDPPQIHFTRKKLKDAIRLPAALRNKVGQLPKMRSYIIPDTKSSVLLGRDYSQQELRILGHYEDSVLKDAYNENPDLDIHDLAQVKINYMLNRDFERKPIKNTGFGIIYGMGLEKLANSTDTDIDTAKELKAAYLSIFPGLGELDVDLKKRGKANEPIRTWGGRVYYVEEPKFNKKQNRWQTFEYKLLNVLIQGSAADCTEQAINNYDANKKHGRLLLTVHDEFLISCPKKYMKKEMEILRDSMESVEFDVPMKSTGKWSDKNWAEMEDMK